MMYTGVGIVILVAVSGFAVVRTRDVTAQVVALGFYGLVTGLMFFFFQAPDVALSQITVGAVALPLMVMLAVSRMKFRASTIEAGKPKETARQEEGTEHD